MLKVLLRWILNALILILITYLVPGFGVTSFYTALIAALALGIVNALIRPILIILTLPINILTLGLFTLIINGFLFWFVSTFIKGFTIIGFWPAFIGAILFSIFSAIINLIDQKD